MDLEQHEYGMKVVEDNKEKSEKIKNQISHQISDPNQQQPQHDSATALQTFLDRIPISSIPGITLSSVVELKIGDSVEDAIRLMYEKNVSIAPIADTVHSESTFGRIAEQYMGLIDFVSLVLWSLEQCENAHVQAYDNGVHENGKSRFLTMLQHHPQVAQTKVGELAKLFLWSPFLPAYLDDSLFHVLLLLSKHHQLPAVPVIEKPDLRVVGFVTQNAVIRSLLQSSGLEWFDGIADKPLSEFRFESQERKIHVYGEQSLAEVLCVLSESRIGAVAVVNQETEIIGCITTNDVYLLLENNELLNERKNLTMEEVIHMETIREGTKPDMDDLFPAGPVSVRSSFPPKVYSPTTAKRSDTLKQAMNNLTKTNGSFCFVLDDLQRPIGMLTLRDIIIEFAPPSIDSGIHGGSFFDNALEQARCQVKNGTIICQH